MPGKNELQPPANAPDAVMIEPTPELIEQAYNAIIEGEFPPEIGDTSITMRAIQDRIRKSDDFDQVFGPQSLTPWTKYVNEAVTVLGFHLNPSQFKETQGAYAVVEIAREPDFAIEQVACGGGNVLMQLVKAWEQGWLPLRVKLIEKPTSSGNTTLWLERA